MSAIDDINVSITTQKTGVKCLLSLCDPISGAYMDCSVKKKGKEIEYHWYFNHTDRDVPTAGLGRIWSAYIWHRALVSHHIKTYMEREPNDGIRFGIPRGDKW